MRTAEDRELIARAQGGDREAAGVLYARHAGLLGEIVRRLRIPRHKAELRAEAALAFVQAIPAYDPARGHFVPFVWGYVYHRVIDFIRRGGLALIRVPHRAILSPAQRRALRSEMEPLDLVLRDYDLEPADLRCPAVGAALEGAKERSRLMGLVDRLPPKERRVFLARHDGETFASIGAREGMTASGALWIYERARARLQKWIATATTRARLGNPAGR